ACPGAADQQARLRESTGHIVDETIDLNGPAQIRIRRLRLIIVSFAGLMDDMNPGHTLAQRSNGIHDSFVDRVRALASAKNQQARLRILGIPVSDLEKG